MLRLGTCWWAFRGECQLPCACLVSPGANMSCQCQPVLLWSRERKCKISSLQIVTQMFAAQVLFLHVALHVSNKFIVVGPKI